MKRAWEFVREDPSFALTMTLLAALLVIGLVAGPEAFGCSVSIDSQPNDTTTTTAPYDGWYESRAEFERGGDTYRCAWVRFQPEGVDLGACERVEGERDGR